jgi:putative ABC transport system substrate-binding protein
MRRRKFIAGLGGAVAWPLVARAQQSERISKIGVPWPGVTFPPPPRMEAFRQALRQLGYVEGQNVAIELRYAQGDGRSYRASPPTSWMSRGRMRRLGLCPDPT